MTFAASAAAGFALKASEFGPNWSSKLGNGMLLEHTLSRVATEPAIMFDNARRVEVIAEVFPMLQVGFASEIERIFCGFYLVVLFVNDQHNPSHRRPIKNIFTIQNLPHTRYMLQSTILGRIFAEAKIYLLISLQAFVCLAYTTSSCS